MRRNHEELAVRFKVGSPPHVVGLADAAAGALWSRRKEVGEHRVTWPKQNWRPSLPDWEMQMHAKLQLTTANPIAEGNVVIYRASSEP